MVQTFVSKSNLNATFDILTTPMKDLRTAFLVVSLAVHKNEKTKERKSRLPCSLTFLVFLKPPSLIFRNRICMASGNDKVVIGN